MTVRVAYSLSGQTPGKEFDELKSCTALLPMGFGDDMLRFNGLGERITGRDEQQRRADSRPTRMRYYQIVKWAAERGMSLTMHWGSDASVDHLLTIFERVNAEVPIAPLRWSIAHLNDASVDSLRRMKALGVGWTVQDAMYFGGEQFLQQAGAEAARRTPPVDTAREDRRRRRAPAPTRIASPRTIRSPRCNGSSTARPSAASAMRGPEETPSRADALRFYTIGQRVVLARRRRARLARSRQARRSRGAVRRLHDRSRSSRSAASNRCSRWSAERSSMPVGLIAGSTTRRPAVHDERALGETQK